MPEPTFDPNAKLEFGTAYPRIRETPKEQWEGLVWRIALGVFLGNLALLIVMAIIAAIAQQAAEERAEQAMKEMMKSWPKIPSVQYSAPNFTPNFIPPTQIERKKFIDQLQPNERCINHQV